MIVCHCLAINDRLIESVAEGASVTVDDIIDRCGAGARCGGCRESIQQVIDEARRGRDVSLPVTVAQ